MIARPRHTVTLAHPFEFQGEAVARLELRRPKMGDLKRLVSGKGDMLERMFALVADLAEVPPEAVADMDPTDFAAVQAWLQPILDPEGTGGGPLDPGMAKALGLE